MKNIKKIIAYILLIGLVLILIRLIFNPIFLIKNIGNVFGIDIENNLSINKWLIGLISFLVSCATFYIYINIFSFKAEKRRNGIIVFIIGFIILSLLMYFQTKDFIYGKDGQPLKCCALNLEGKYEIVDDCDQKVHNISGEPVIKCTKSILKGIKNIKESQVKRIQSNNISQFFSKNGKPRVWVYERNDGKYELFNESGFHPELGYKLEPINTEIAKKIINNRDKGKINEIIYNPQNSSNNISVSNSNFSNTRIERPYISINSSVINKHNQIDTAIIIIDDNGNIDRNLGNIVGDKLFNNNQLHYGLIPNINKESFSRLFNGDFKSLNLYAHVDKIVIGKYTASTRNSNTKNRNKSCDLSIMIYIYETRTGNLLKTISKSGGGLGFTDFEAKNNAIKNIL